MKRTSVFVVFLLAGMLTPIVQAQIGSTPTINVHAAGKVSAAADLAIIFMVIRSSAGLASDALSQNAKKAQDVEARLTALGLSGKAKFSGNRFAPAGPPYYGGAPRPVTTGFEVSEYVYVFLEGSELRDATRFEKRVGDIIDDLIKVGASAVDTPVPRLCQQFPCSVAFTVKDPSLYLKEANLQATQKARAAAEQIAHGLGVAVTGIQGVNVSPTTFYNAPAAYPLDDLPYDFLSTWKDAIPVTITLNVQFSFH